MSKNPYLGMPIRTCNYIFVDKKRSLLERLFTLPWQPFKKYKKVPGYIIDHQKNVIYCHSKKMLEIKQLVNKEKS